MRATLKTTIAALSGAALVLSGLASVQAGHNADDHSDNVRLLAERKIIIDPDGPDEAANWAQGSDLAFQKDLMVAGTYQGVGFFKVLPSKPYLRQISFFNCAGSQGDVSVYGDLVFVSIDGPRTNQRCDSLAASAAESAVRADWEGLRVVSIKNLNRPEQIAAVRTPCGSHTHTLVPADDKLYLYIESYPLTGQSQDCNAVSHRKISIIEVPLDDPASAHMIDPLTVGTTIGCHDVTVFPQRDLAFAACITESQVWDISNPAQPAVMARIRNPEINIHHSSGLTWDGKIAVIGDEFAGAEGGGCVGNSDVPVGAMWFYDVTDPSAPQEVGFYGPPRVFEFPDSPDEAERPRCTTHNFNVVPMKDSDRYIAVASYYSVALSVVDFSDPAAAEEIGYYLPKESGTNPDSWSAYWYNGLIYSNDFGSRAGIRVFRMDELTLRDTFAFKVRFNPQTQIK